MHQHAEISDCIDLLRRLFVDAFRADRQAVKGFAVKSTSCNAFEASNKCMETWEVAVFTNWFWDFRDLIIIIAMQSNFSIQGCQAYHMDVVTQNVGM